MSPTGTTSQVIEVEEPSWLRRLFSVFAPVKRSEVVTVAILTVNVFVLLTCSYVLKVVREPLILLGGGGAELKAYASAGQALLLLAVVPAFGWLSSRVSRVRLLTTMQVVFIACLLAFYALAQAEAPVGLAFYLWFGIFNILVVSNFWSFANDLYNEEQGKRLFAVVGIGASIGAIVGAFVPQVLHRSIGMYSLMLVTAAGLGVSIVLYRVADLRHRRGEHGGKTATPSDDTPALSREGGFALVIRDRYLRLLAAMLFVATIVNTSGEYVMSKMATDRAEEVAAEVTAAEVAAASPAAASPAADAGSDARGDDRSEAVKKAQDEYVGKFYSDYYSLVNLLAFLIQSLLVARVLTWLGIRRALFIMPVIVMGGWLALSFATSITLLRITKTAENSLDYSLHNTLRHALFLPTNRERKYKAKAAIDTFFFRMGDVVAGLGIVFVLVEVLGLGVRAFAIMNVVLALCWIVLAARAGRLHDKLVAARDGDELAAAGAKADGHGVRR